jgi:hypothetical protein
LHHFAVAVLLMQFGQVDWNKKMPRKPKNRIPIRNKSPFGWWVASYLERLEYEDEDENNPGRRCIAWENTIILKAKDREAAYRKAEKIGRLGNDLEAYQTIDGRKAIWKYEGLTSLLPIYEELEDGAEIIWRAHANRTVKKIQSWVKSKDKLETFDDNEQEV